MNASFSDFFKGVWGVQPFPWQARLAERVANEGWPTLLDIPTGCGKTAALDIALWNLARDGGQRAPRRIVLVVDRRVIVDQVGERTRGLKHALETSLQPAVVEVARALRDLVGPNAPLLESATLRGGVIQEEAWSHYPHVPVLAASTVDQVGSRLLFRGYGISDGMRPIHAGLVGCDTLLLLDEVHLARPFADFLEQLYAVRGEEGEVPRRFQFVQLSATSGHVVGERFSLEEADTNHPVLAPRVQVNKPATLKQVTVKANDEEAIKLSTLGLEAAKNARELIAENRHAVVVVLNRVDGARRTWEALEDDDIDRVLLTGRMRPLDQAAVLRSLLPRIRAGREPQAGRPLVVVATQCIEAGADFDFDGMVTECASVDSLRQRFGRLDRFGSGGARAVVLVRSDQLKPTDPIYGEALSNTWSWLKSIETDGVVDVGTHSLDRALRERDEGHSGLLAPFREAPVVLPAYLDQWVQTRPIPQADPEPSLFLHGIPNDSRERVPDVLVVWRADLEVSDLGDELKEKEHSSDLPPSIEEMLEAVPPGSLEALSLPIWTVRAWLKGQADQLGVSDVEGELEPDSGARHPSTDRDAYAGIVWKGRGNSRLVRASDLRPGDLLVVSSTLGGLGPHQTFDPADLRIVPDLGDTVQLLQRGRPVLRVSSAVHPLGPGSWQDLPKLSSLEDEEEDAREIVLRWFKEIDPTALTDPWMAVIIRIIAERGLLRRWILGLSRGWVLQGPSLKPSALRELLTKLVSDSEAPVDLTTEGDLSSFSGREFPLDPHLVGVADLAEDFAKRCGLSNSLIRTLWWAGRIHDIGKVDPAFQLWLHDADPVAMAGAKTPLAKSGSTYAQARTRQEARSQAGYPTDQRHELVSLDMAESSISLQRRLAEEGADWELMLHLVASHHGWCRPLAPAAMVEPDKGVEVAYQVEDLTLKGTTAHGRARLSSGVADRFWHLVRRYGWHELAYLEAILRLADHRRSAAEQQGVEA